MGKYTTTAAVVDLFNPSNLKIMEIGPLAQFNLMKINYYVIIR